MIRGEHCDLIERLAQRIADSILLSWRVKKTIVTVHKPQAPIEQDFGDVSVTIERAQSDYEEQSTPTAASLYTAQQREQGSHTADDDQQPRVHTAVIALGGNLGDVPQTFRTAIVAMAAVAGNQITGISALYRLTPIRQIG